MNRDISTNQRIALIRERHLALLAAKRAAEKRTCTRCRHEKPTSEFWRYGVHGTYRPRCKVCMRETDTTHAERNRRAIEKRRERNAEVSQ